MLKDYRSRVLGTYDFLRSTLEEVNRSPETLLHAVRAADRQTIDEGLTYDPTRQVPLRYKLTDNARPYELKAVEYHTEESSVSGDLRVVFGSKPLDLTVNMYDTFSVLDAIAPPLYYIIPVQWSGVIDVMNAHGLDLNRLIAGTTLEVESYRFENVSWPSGPFEGRQMPTFYAKAFREQRFFPAGSVIVPLAQRSAKVVINLLEPQAPDSFVAWGFFNAVFEHKEYAEDYVMEQLARQMLASDPALFDEFNQRLASDEEFVASPSQRLEFFYSRSPYWDPQRCVYPVGRLCREIELETEKFTK
jgi:hypothetical protein